MDQPSNESTPSRYRLLITAGPTREPIDEVRFVGNRSSGRLGIALAEAAIRRGIVTTLLLGPTHLDPPQVSQLRTVRFQTTAELRDLLAETLPDADVLVMAAAVADYRPVASPGKIRRGEGPLTLELEPTPDLLAEAARRSRNDQTLVGFAVEPADRLLDSAADKLRRKRIDAIVANPLETMESSEITATMLVADGRRLAAPPGMSKTDFADWLLDRITEIHPKGTGT